MTSSPCEHFARLLAALLVFALAVAACGAARVEFTEAVAPTPVLTELEATAEPVPTREQEATAEPVPTREQEPTAEPVPTELEATAEPVPTREQEPTAEPVPPESSSPVEPTPAPTTPAAIPAVTLTPVPATGPVLVEGDGWSIRQSEFDQLVSFVEEVHQLDFLGPVTFRTEPDIGAAFAQGFEIFSDDDWRLMQALNISGGFDRETVNQARRDRIRGVCCDIRDTTEVIVELNPTKLETMTILVHELVHALHTQQPGLFEDLPPPQGEIPVPFSASTEGVPQYVAFAYFALAPQPEQDVVASDLPIIRDDMIPTIGIGAARYLNFAYATGPAFVDQVVAARGLAGLSDLIRNPPISTEQVLYPAKYLIGENAVPVGFPARDGRLVVTQGRLGVAMLIFALDADVTSQPALDLLQGWAGDAFFTYIDQGRVCVAASVLMDTSTQAAALASALAEQMSSDAVTSSGMTVGFESCEGGGR